MDPHPRQSTFFIKGEGIDREIISLYICQYLGNDALVKSWRDPKTGIQLSGYYITAYRAPTSAQISDLRTDSAMWQAEQMKSLRKSMKISKSRNRDNIEDREESDSDRDLMDMNESPLAQRPTLARSNSAPLKSIQGNIRDITIINPKDGSRRDAVALLDTGCLRGNWISSRLVKNLQAQDFINAATFEPMRAANGGIVLSQGTITIDWRWSLDGVRVHTATFNVWDAPHHDVILGIEYIMKEGLISWNQHAFSPLIEHTPMNISEAEAMRQAAITQQQEKAAREIAKNKVRDKLKK